MSYTIFSKALVDEFGDVIIWHSLYSTFSNIPFETIDDEYRRLLLPSKVSQVTIRFGILIMLTEDNRILVIDNDHPHGIYVEFNIDIKQFHDTAPLTILDMDENLHFIDLASLVNSIDSSFNMKGYITKPIIRGVMDTYSIQNHLLIMTDDRIIAGDASKISRGRLGWSDKLKPGYKRLSGQLVVYDDEILEYDISDVIGEGPKIIYPHIGELSTNGIIIGDHRTIYCMDNEDNIYELIFNGRESHYEKIDIDFIPARFISLNNGDWFNEVVEDVEGNLYTIPELEPYELPVKLYNDKKRGRLMIRPAHNTGYDSS